MKRYDVNGYSLAYTSRRGWKANLRLRGKLVDTVPVTWTKGRRQRGREEFLKVWIGNAEERLAYSKRTEPFVVAVAIAKDYSELPHAFSAFDSIWLVSATGRVLRDKSIETRLIERLSKS